MKTLSKTILTVLATGVISCGLLSQQAQAIGLFTDTLADLSANPSNSISIGDKVFNGFSFTTNGLSGFDATAVHVTASFDQAHGIYFLTYTGTLGALVGGAGSVADLLLNYTVTATAGQISMIDQQFTGGNAPMGSGFITVDETAAVGGIVFGHSHLEIGDFSDPPIEGDQLIIDPAQTFLNVTKDIGYSLVATGTVSLSSVTQSFHQTVPDGGSAVALLGIALAGIEGARRVFRARKG